VTEEVGAPGRTTAAPWIGPGWRARRRPIPQLGHLLGAAGGALAMLGPIVYGGESSDGGASGTTGAVLCLLAVVAALVAMHWAPGPVRAGCTSVVAVGIPAFWIFLLVVDTSPAESTTVFAAVLLSYAVVWAAGPARGRGILLALALLVAWNWAVSEVGDFDTSGSTRPVAGSIVGADPTDVPGLVTAAAWPTRVEPARHDSASPTADIDPVGDFDSDFDSDFDDDFDDDFETDFETDFDFDEELDADFGESPFGPKGGEIGGVSLFFGVAYLGAAWASDRRGRAGLASPLAGVGLVAALSGAAVLGIDSEQAWLAGLLVALVGLGVAWVGSRATRRATTWLGAAAVAVGVGVVCGDIADDSTDTFALLAVVGGTLITALGWLLTRWQPEHPDGDVETPFATTAPPVTQPPGAGAGGGDFPPSPPPTPPA